MMYQKTFTNEPESHRSRPYKYPSCKFCEGVSCGFYDSKGRRADRNCETCGHNPEVAKERLKKYCEKHGISLQKAKK